MFVFLNGRFVPEAQATVPVSDRGFLYGDGVFETMRIRNGQPVRWTAHCDRLARGAAFLKLRLPLAPDPMLEVARRLVELNASPESVLRLTLTRGTGPRGCSPRGAESPTLVMTLHPAPAGPPAPARVITSSYRVTARDPLAAFKTCSKLTHVMARAEADARGADDALLLNTEGHLAEATSSNVFWVEDGGVCTPPVQAGALAGTTRALVLESCRAWGLPAREAAVPPAALRPDSALFLTRCTAGLVALAELDGRPLPSSPLVARLQAAWEQSSQAD